jgi:O-antigen/teichoic acid export membrane protein
MRNLRQLAKSATARDTTVVFASTIANALLGGLFFIIAPRILGPADYGLFATVASTAILISNIAHLGIDTGVLRFASTANKERRQGTLKLAFNAYSAIGIAAIFLGFIFTPFLTGFLGNENLTPLFRMAFATIILILFSDFFISALQSKKDFTKASLLNISANTARLLLVILASYFFTLDLFLISFIFFTVPIISVILGRIFVPTDFLKARNQKGSFKNFFSFNFWIFATLVISTIPFDNYFLLKISGPVSAGLYSAPFKLISISDQFAGNFSRVLAPRFSSFTSAVQAKNYAIKTLPIIALCSLAISSAAIIASPVVNFALGKEFTASVPVLQITALGFAFYFANTTAVSLLIYFFGQSKLTFAVTLVVKSLWAFLTYMLVMSQAQIGAAYAFLISGILSFILFNCIAFYKLKTIK